MIHYYEIVKDARLGLAQALAALRTAPEEWVRLRATQAVDSRRWYEEIRRREGAYGNRLRGRLAKGGAR